MLEKSKLVLKKCKLKEGLLKIIFSKKNRKLKLYKDFLNGNLNNLKRINATSTRAVMEIKLKKETSIPAFDWQEKIVSLNNIFVMMLGIIDARNDDYKRILEFKRRFNNKEDIEHIELKQKKISEYRVKILKDYNCICEKNDIEVIKETMMCNPSYKNFDNLFRDMQTNSYNLVIQGQLISAYMFGYNNSLYIYLNDIISYYNQIINEYKLDEAKNSCNYQKVNRKDK